MNTKKVYILLTHTGTYFSRAIHLLGNTEFTHVSIALDRDLNELYSFGRLNPRNPIIGGFVKENIDSGVFALNPNINCRLYSLEIPIESYIKIQGIIRSFYTNKEEYNYSLIGLFTCAINIPLYRERHFFCSEFVSYVLHTSDITLFNKNPSLVRPDDFLLNDRLRLEYAGLLNEINIES